MIIKQNVGDSELGEVTRQRKHVVKDGGPVRVTVLLDEVIW